MSKRVNNRNVFTMEKCDSRYKYEHLQSIYMNNINLNITYNKLYVLIKSQVIASVRT